MDYPTHKDHEIIWTEINTTTKPTYIGAYYGPQEKCKKDEVDRQYQEIANTVLRLQQEGDVLLVGDFNAKLYINIRNIQQEDSRNGKLLQEIIDLNNLHLPSITEETADWTRENRTKPSERSVIDYIITTEDSHQRIKDIHIDKEKELLLTGKKPSDHNTITCTLHAKTKKIPTKTIIQWAPGNKETWKDYNDKMNSLHPDTYKNYDEVEKQTIANLMSTIGTITIRGPGRKFETKETNTLRTNKKSTKKEFERAIKTNAPDATITAKRMEYKQAQKELRQQIQQETKERTKAKMDTMIREGGTKSRNFWKIRKKLLKNNENLEKHMKDEDGNDIKKPQSIKKHIADYYENLYKARDPTKGYEEQLRIETEDSRMRPFTMKELNEAIKKLKRNKATGPNRIPNSAFMEANKTTRQLFLNTFNHITRTKNIPIQWQQGEIIRIYKGKGVKGKCSTERGITLSSNMGKLYERLINQRILRKIEITEQQAGDQREEQQPTIY